MLRKLFTLISSIGLLWGLTIPAFAAGDAAAGKEKSITCVACHGADGNGVAPDFPKISGQIPGYIASQLAAYKSGQRKSAMMMGMMTNLTEQDMQDLDAYYSQFQFSKASIGESDLASANRGREIYRRGLTQYAVPACMACHGPSGDGIPARYPKVSGQYKNYLITSLRDFKSGVRVNEEMNTIAFRLTEQEIADLATYLHGLD
ncbi:MAG: c-type cytochrome [Acidiferrobacterales bacterium]|nr:c-type cytochrome [Acidiferrobacterales bacterium]